MRKDTFERIKNQLYFALIAFTAFIAISFSYMTSVFWTSVKGTGYAIWTYLIAAPVLFSVILLFALIFLGKEQIINEMSDFLTGSRN